MRHIGRTTGSHRLGVGNSAQSRLQKMVFVGIPGGRRTRWQRQLAEDAGDVGGHGLSLMTSSAAMARLVAPVATWLEHLHLACRQATDGPSVTGHGAFHAPGQIGMRRRAAPTALARRPVPTARRPRRRPPGRSARSAPGTRGGVVRRLEARPTNPPTRAGAADEAAARASPSASRTGPGRLRRGGAEQKRRTPHGREPWSTAPRRQPRAAGPVAAVTTATST